VDPLDEEEGQRMEELMQLLSRGGLLRREAMETPEEEAAMLQRTMRRAGTP
jgi:hypothetical protein